jgi:hypothetical protein
MTVGRADQEPAVATADPVTTERPSSFHQPVSPLLSGLVMA